jgi:hypothetical protein
LFFVLINISIFRHGSNTLGAFVGWLVSVSVVLVPVFIYLGIRASPRGIHQFGDGLVRWESIVNATREESIVRYGATIGLGGKVVPRSLVLNPAFERALHGWVPKGHPLLRAIDSKDGLSQQKRMLELQLDRCLPAPSWDAPLAERTRAYLRERGFTKLQVSLTEKGPVVTGIRGRWLANFTKFDDLTKLPATLRITGGTGSALNVELRVRMFGYHATQWHVAAWRLELVDMGHVLNNRTRMPEHVWRRFDADRKAAARRSLSIDWHRLSPSWETELRQLECTNETNAT